MRAAQIANAGQHQNCQNLRVAALRRKIENLVRALASFLNIAVRRFAQRRHSLPDGCRFVELRVLRGLDGPSGELARFFQMSPVRFRVRLESQHRVFTAWLARGPGHLALHARGLAAQKSQRIKVSVHGRIIELARECLVQYVLRLFQALQSDVSGRQILVPSGASRVEA